MTNPLLDLTFLAAAIAVFAIWAAASYRRNRRARQQQQTLLDVLVGTQTNEAPGGPAQSAPGPVTPHSQLDPEQLAELLRLLRQSQSPPSSTLLDWLSPRWAWEAGSRIGERVTQRP